MNDFDRDGAGHGGCGWRTSPPRRPCEARRRERDRVARRLLSSVTHIADTPWKKGARREQVRKPRSGHRRLYGRSLASNGASETRTTTTLYVLVGPTAVRPRGVRPLPDERTIVDLAPGRCRCGRHRSVGNGPLALLCWLRRSEACDPRSRGSCGSG